MCKILEGETEDLICARDNLAWVRLASPHGDRMTRSCDLTEEYARLQRVGPPIVRVLRVARIPQECGACQYFQENQPNLLDAYGAWMAENGEWMSETGKLEQNPCCFLAGRGEWPQASLKNV